MGLLGVGVVLLWIVAGVLCWLGYQLMRQNGRMLLRLDELEARLAQRKPTPAPAPHRPSGLPIGSPAPAFDLPDLNGSRMDLEQLRGRRVLLIFFNPNCGFCRQMAPDLAAVQGDGRPEQPIPIVITTGGLEANRQLVREHTIRYQVLLQQQMEIASAYQVTGTPMGYVLDEQGRIASPLAVGAQALLTLATASSTITIATIDGGVPDALANGNGHKRYRGNRSLADSHIIRNGLPAGTPAPNFHLPRLEGGDLSLEEYRGERTLLVFSDPTCGPCTQLLPELECISRHMLDLKVVMIGRGDPQANQEKVAAYGLTFPIVLQRQWEISRAYGIFATPVAYLVDEAGVIAADVAVGVESILKLVEASAGTGTGTKEVVSGPV
jgi:peroxiredoxin